MGVYTKRYAGGFVDRPALTTAADSQFLNAVEAALITLYGVTPLTNGAMVWDGTQFRADAKIVNANVDAAAAIDYSKLAVPAGAITKAKLGALGIVDADVAAGAAIAMAKLGFPAPAVTLPGSPTTGDIAILVDSLTVPTYSWVLKWNSALTTPAWVFVGGYPAIVEVVTGETTASATYVALTTAGPAFTTPRAGTYDVAVGAQVGAGTAFSYMSYDIGVTGAVDGDAAASQNAAINNPAQSTWALRRKTGLANATTLTAKYRSTGGTTEWYFRRMYVWPVALT